MTMIGPMDGIAGTTGAMARTKPRVALLVDGDNISSDHAGRIIMAACRHGEITIRCIYGNAAQAKGWTAAPGFRFVHAGCGKNATDVLLAIEAVDLSHTGTAEVFALASSDRDFSHLAHHLRERGFPVIGIGEEKAPDGWRKACTRFHDIGEKAAEPGAAVPKPIAALATMDQQIRAVIVEAGDLHGCPIAEIGAQMHKRHGTRISTLPETNWRSYLEARPTLYACDPRGPQASVRWIGPS